MCFRGFESVTSLEDSVVREVTLVLREWSAIWKTLYVVRNVLKYIKCKEFGRLGV